MATLEGGNSGDTTLNGSDVENDSIWGAGGADTLRGGPAAGTGGGNDLLDGGTGADQLYGGDGNDTLIGGSGNGDDTLYGGAGIDTADFSRNLTDLLVGTTFSPSFDPNTTAVNVNLATGVATGLGTDQLYSIENVLGGGGADVITGNDAANLLNGAGGADLINGGVGTDTLIGGDANDTLYGGVDNDILFGDAGADRLFGGSGADTLVGGAGADSLNGGLGSDTADYSSSTGGVNVNLNDAAAESGGDAAGDTLTSIENIIGSGNDDILVGSNVANELFGGGGADSIVGNLGSDYIDGGAGNDTINSGPDTIAGGAASPVNEFLDWTTPGSFNGQDLPTNFTQDTGTMRVTVDYVPGVGTAFDVYTGTIYSPETLIGNNSGAFLSRSGAGELTELSMNFAAEAGSGMTNQVSNVRFRITDIDREDWTDSVTILAYDELGNVVPVSITTTSGEIGISGNTATANGNGTDPNASDGAILVSIAGPVSQIVIQYTDLNDAGQFIVVSDVHFTTIPATADTSDADTVVAGLGDDLVETGIGADLIYGDQGRDTISGEAGNDTLYGGTENDLLYGGDNADVVFGGADQDTLFGDAGNDTLSGDSGDDRIVGGLGNDSIDAGVGSDLVYGDEGDDTINFDAGNDTVFGGDGSDLIDDQPTLNLAGFNLIYGGAGNDTVWAGNDADTVFGDAGNDRLSGEAGNDLLYGGVGTDTIFGGDDRDEIRVTFNPTGNDVLGSESVDGGSGAGTSSDNDTLRVDILGFGWGRIDLVYDPLNSENGTITFFAANGSTVVGTLTFTDIENLIIVCFTAGTQIITDRGAVAVEALAAGDLVLTRDNGMQPLRWVGRRVLSAADLVARPELQP
ncbi:MAG TPA: Hint domain-containing protein, partial [Tabrizicola sp.]|nr:Hint domain-containing protein [Tabrizicola sp.]